MPLLAHHAGEQALAPLLLLAGGGLALLVALTRDRLAAARARFTGKAPAETLAPAADQRQVDLVDDLDRDAVGEGGGAAGDVLVAQEHDGDGGDPGVEGFRRGLAPGDGAA